MQVELQLNHTKMSVRKRQIFTAMQVVVNAATKVYAANGVNKVWECYVAGISPTNATQSFRTIVSWENGEPKISWEPKLAIDEETA